MKTYRVGIIGLGRMGSTIDDEGHMKVAYSVAAACKASERLEVAAGCDLQAERRVAFTERWGVEAVYEDYMGMVRQEGLDMVAVCTTASGLLKPANKAPDAGFRGDSHAELSVALSDAGVPMLYVEKAMASSVQAADEVLAACKRNDTVFNTGVLRRFDNRYLAQRDAVVNGDIGTPKAAVHYAASSLMHGHIHSIDTLSFLLGDPKITAVRGDLQPRHTQIKGNHISADPLATFELAFENGVQGLTVPAGGWEFEVLGDKGTVRSLNNGVSTVLRAEGETRGRRTLWEDVPVQQVEPQSTVVSCLEDLVEAHETGRPTLGNIDVAHHITEACIAVAESHRRGGAWVELPLAERDLYIFHI
jgi:predicted dehydrogenase